MTDNNVIDCCRRQERELNALARPRNKGEGELREQAQYEVSVFFSFLDDDGDPAIFDRPARELLKSSLASFYVLAYRRCESDLERALAATSTELERA